MPRRGDEEDDDDIEEGEEEEEEEGEHDEEEEKKPEINYDELDENGHFKKYEKIIYDAFLEAKQKHLAEEGESADEFDVETWIQTYVENTEYDENRVKYVANLGIYGGERHEDSNARHGNGEALYTNGDRYKGQFDDGTKHGRGLYNYNHIAINDLDKKIEEIKKEEAIQKKLMLDPSQAIDDILKKADHPKLTKLYVELNINYGPHPFYDGEFVKDHKEGHGTMKYPDGSIYVGDWKSSKRHGSGKMYFINGDVYNGEFQDGLKHGQGSYRFAKLDCEYDGEWEKGEIKRGSWKMPDNIIFQGNFEDNLPNEEEGEMIFPSE